MYLEGMTEIALCGFNQKVNIERLFMVPFQRVHFIQSFIIYFYFSFKTTTP